MIHSTILRRVLGQPACAAPLAGLRLALRRAMFVRLAKKNAIGSPIALRCAFFCPTWLVRALPGRSRDAPRIDFRGRNYGFFDVCCFRDARSFATPDPHETLRGRTNFKLRAFCNCLHIERKLASSAARKEVCAGNALDERPEATQEGSLGARDGQLGALNCQLGGQDGELGGRAGPTWRPEAVLDTSLSVPESATSGRNRPRSKFHQIFSDFRSIFR